MGFSAFVVAPAAGKGSGFSASLIKRRGPASLKFFLRMDVAARLGWSDGDMLAVQLGHGEDHGLVRLRKSGTGSAPCKMRQAARGGAYLQITLGFVPAFVDRAEAKRWCQYEALDGDEAGWVEVVLPSWADETGGKRRQRLLPPPLPSPLPPPPARDPGRLPGDPPPGRSALDRRAPATRGEALRRAEEREAEAHAAAEAAEWNAKAEEGRRLFALMSTFGLTLTEAKVMQALMGARTASKQSLMDATYGDMPGGGPVIRTIDVMVYKLRKKLHTRQIDIETVRGMGYRMSPEHVARAMVLVDRGTPGRDEDEAELAAMEDEEA